jgi:hypothetical protein
MSFRTLEEAVVGLCNDVMGTEVSYTPFGGAPVTINGVFDNAYIDAEGIVSVKPTLRIRLSDLEDNPAKNDTVEISSTTYKVMESHEDGFGGSTLFLKKV